MMLFEWDEQKRVTNLDQHGIDFADATRVFDGPTLDRKDDRRDYNETRVVALGEIEGIVLSVIYTTRGQAVRLISARRASRDEREAYNARLL